MLHCVMLLRHLPTWTPATPILALPSWHGPMGRPTPVRMKSVDGWGGNRDTDCMRVRGRVHIMQIGRTRIGETVQTSNNK